MKPEIVFYPVIPLEESQRHADFARSLDLPVAEETRGPGGLLAVVGGGLSLASRLDELRAWEGDIWAINETWAYLRDNGIDATFYSIHPRARVADMLRGAKKCIVSLQSAPETFATALRHGAEILTTDVFQHEGSSSAPRATNIAFSMGYEAVVFFGIDCAFQPGKTHISVNHDPDQFLIVECGGESYLTTMQLYLQAQEIVDQLKTLPDRVFYRGGGLVYAFMNHDDHDVKAYETWAHKFSRLTVPDPMVAPLEENTGNPGWGDDGAADVRAAE